MESFLEVGGEAKPVLGKVPSDYVLEPGLVDGDSPLLQSGYLGGIDVNTPDIVAVLCKACPVTSPTYPVPMMQTLITNPLKA